ncbi:MAG: bifunctional phosphoribosylaminoimidazolecarboxamide formyltransferase/IMP cyclohydrolase [Bacteroidales bacterium]|nr:bifunctional phosphoribosylaminoimidazolecarboxamide formyltransferase/IMP cyclohydrolase [Bacteroidales bacterium]
MEKHPGKKLSRALISVYKKEGLQSLVEALQMHDIEIVSTGGTKQFIESLGVDVVAVEDLTSYPPILGGRVKTLHPAIFGGILCRPDKTGDRENMQTHGIQAFDMVVVDLYPFEERLSGGASHEEIIEEIDIGGVSLIRAAAKNFDHVLVVPSSDYFDEIAGLLKKQHGTVTMPDRRRMASVAMNLTSHYDAAIFDYLNNGEINAFKQSILDAKTLRYGENPHQQACFYGKLDEIFEQLHGKELSYNNLLDIDAAMALMAEFSAPSFAIIKHTNACGAATRDSIEEAWEEALAGDPVSAFGGILIANRNIGPELALSINELFFEVLIAPSYDDDSLALLCSGKNRIILKTKSFLMPDYRYRSLLNGVLWQTSDYKNTIPEQWKIPTLRKPTKDEEKDLVFANSVVKHLKSNAIALVKDLMLIGAGNGQTSRVAAVEQAIEKAKAKGHLLEGAVMASDAFFPFPDAVERAHKAGITAVIQPGGSIKDSESVAYCNQANMAMAFTGNRHFRH